MRAEAERVACATSVTASGTELKSYRLHFNRYPDTLQALQDNGYLSDSETSGWTVAYLPTPDGELCALTATTSGGETCGSTSG